MGPRVRGDDTDCFAEFIIGPAEGGARWLLAMTLSNVVPAKAGTHNHRRLLEQKPLATVPKVRLRRMGPRVRGDDTGCFAEFIIGPAEGGTRWLLAMTKLP